MLKCITLIIRNSIIQNHYQEFDNLIGLEYAINFHLFTLTADQRSNNVLTLKFALDIYNTSHRCCRYVANLHLPKSLTLSTRDHITMEYVPKVF